MQPAREVRSFDVGPIPGFTLVERHYQPDARQPLHDHEDTRLIVTLRGAFTEDWGPRRHSCGPASVLLRPAGERHSNRYGASGAVCLGIRFEEEWSGVFERDQIRGGSDASPEMASSARRLCSELRAGGGSMIGIQCGVLDIVTRFSRPRNPVRERRPPSWIESTEELLRSRLNNPPDLLEAARQAGVHPGHLSRAFRQFTRMTMGAYLRRQRIEYACTRLRDSESSLAGIALDAGFCDQAHFSRVFRRQLGVTPSDFRRLHREG